MAWFKVDDKLRGNKKVRRLRLTRAPRRLKDDLLPALGLWTICGSWASDNLTDGFVPENEVTNYDLGEYFASVLVASGMWSEVVLDGEPGFLFHDWHEFNPTAEKVKAERAASKERVRKWREAKRNGSGNAARNDGGNGVRNGERTVPPTRPDPTPPKGGRGEGSGLKLSLVDNWCGQCDERTRLLELPDGRAKHCPDCHPRRAVS